VQYVTALDLPDAILKNIIQPRTRIGINISDWLGINSNEHFHRCKYKLCVVRIEYSRFKAFYFIKFFFKYLKLEYLNSNEKNALICIHHSVFREMFPVPLHEMYICDYNELI